MWQCCVEVGSIASNNPQVSLGIENWTHGSILQLCYNWEPNGNLGSKGVVLSRIVMLDGYVIRMMLDMR